MKKKKKKFFIKIAIDSPAAAGAGTLAKSLSKHYNLFYLDTGKIYRFIANLKINYPKKFNQGFLKKRINNLKIKDLEHNELISNKVGKNEQEILDIIEIYSNDSTSFYEFVEDINKNYDKDEKLSLLGFMWKIAYADGRLDVDEERLIRRLADMIKIKDIDVLRLKDKNKN